MTNKKALSLVDQMLVKVHERVISPSVLDSRSWEPTVGLVDAFGQLLSYRADLLDAISIEQVTSKPQDEFITAIIRRIVFEGIAEHINGHHLLGPDPCKCEQTVC